MLHNSILDVIGQTPIVRLAQFSEDLGIEVYAKLESLNPGGSHKARIALGMILDAERRGVLIRDSGQTIIEPSGGNTGIGLVMAGNVLGYKVVLVIPDNYSPEKQKLLRLYGAKVVLSDSRLGNNSHGEKCMELQLENPSYVMLNQQRNGANPQTHRDTTAPEILRAFGEQRVDYFVSGIGTGGHITGIGETLKAAWPHIRVMGVEPEECDLLKDRHAPHGIQGLSIGLIPSILNLEVLDGMLKVSHQACVDMIKRIMRTDAISLGLSSAANMVAIAQLAPELPPETVVLTMVYDNADSYLPSFE
ncbi:PLP-dependent cysteine synthase family protein [Pseudomonas palleroniana]|uniref:Cysteine synthase B n=1 Tax=Pseudomonas palleroniana TaxID=191390 RepID=A0A1H5MTG3_9PSED|nr:MULTISPECIES: PLP-dependent cysteine synthase family protein [Pseudomonas]KAB0565371.1 PLP-dependent cysteine synthase family protein [Pseudomonas palleroniana]NCE86946.1 PLP-dependent cysteine synthase family protein [Pseudomonas sp. Q1]PTC21726.1 PLP-dependent cysteine synthase family protein [Pseudomonas palleroniana]UOK40149.1 PLP-dependent cysteine synthase family protein [Pseudomonas palleroniana]SEE92655.1 cysteine synthase A [Pseudomonas palleroniana]